MCSVYRCLCRSADAQNIIEMELAAALYVISSSFSFILLLELLLVEQGEQKEAGREEDCKSVAFAGSPSLSVYQPSMMCYQC